MIYTARMALTRGHSVKESAMAESSDIWKLHLVYRLSQIQERFDEDVLGKVRAIEGVTSVDVVPSHDTSTRLAFSTCYSNAVVAANAAKKCLQDAVDEHNATWWWWQRKVRLVDEPAVRKVA
jgi:hypothetical protein